MAGVAGIRFPASWLVATRFGAPRENKHICQGNVCRFAFVSDELPRSSDLNLNGSVTVNISGVALGAFVFLLGDVKGMKSRERVSFRVRDVMAEGAIGRSDAVEAVTLGTSVWRKRRMPFNETCDVTGRAILSFPGVFVIREA